MKIDCASSISSFTSARMPFCKAGSNPKMTAFPAFFIYAWRRILLSSGLPNTRKILVKRLICSQMWGGTVSRGEIITMSCM